MPVDGKKRAPFEKIDLKGSDLELATLSRLDHSPDTSGVDLFIRSREQRTRGTNC